MQLTYTSKLDVMVCPFFLLLAVEASRGTRSPCPENNILTEKVLPIVGSAIAGFSGAILIEEFVKW